MLKCTFSKGYAKKSKKQDRKKGKWAIPRFLEVGGGRATNKTRVNEWEEKRYLQAGNGWIWTAGRRAKNWSKSRIYAICPKRADNDAKTGQNRVYNSYYGKYE